MPSLGADQHRKPIRTQSVNQTNQGAIQNKISTATFKKKKKKDSYVSPKNASKSLESEIFTTTTPTTSKTSDRKRFPSRS